MEIDMPRTAAFKSFGRTECRRFDDEVMSEIEAVAAKYGLTVQRGRGTYNDTQFNVKLTFVVKETGNGLDGEEVVFARDAFRLGIPAEWRGKTFMSRGHIYTITRLDLRKRKMPILANRDDGMRFKFSVDAVDRALAMGMKNVY